MIGFRLPHGYGMRETADGSDIVLKLRRRRTMKRSRRVVLTLMGTAAIGAVSMGLVPRDNCGPYGRPDATQAEVEAAVEQAQTKKAGPARSRP